MAAVLGVSAERLLVLAGLSLATDNELDAAAARFAARLEPVAPWTRGSRRRSSAGAASSDH